MNIIARKMKINSLFPDIFSGKTCVNHALKFYKNDRRYNQPPAERP